MAKGKSQNPLSFSDQWILKQEMGFIHWLNTTFSNPQIQSEQTEESATTSEELQVSGFRTLSYERKHLKILLKCQLIYNS